MYTVADRHDTGDFEMEYTHSMKMALKGLQDAVEEASNCEGEEYELIMTHVQALDDLIDYLARKSEED
jgi:hypothetical protein